LTQTAIESRVGLKNNFLNLRTLFGVIVGGFVIYIFLKNFDFTTSIKIISQVKIPFLFLAILAFYLSLPIRAWRWRVLLSPTGNSVNIAPLSHYYYLAWFANAILPARIGDIYRAYLLRKNKDVPISLSLGTLLSERVFDLAISAILMVLSGAYYWGAIKNSGEKSYLVWGLIAVLAIIIFFTLIISFFPLLMKIAPSKIREKLELFRNGIFRWPALLPGIIAMTLVIWLSEALRLYLVFLAFGIKAGFLMAVFISQASLILMSIPLSPAGLGLVELLMLKLLSTAGLSPATAGAITIIDRLISYWSLVASGGIVYLFSPRVR
jgi:glycosyltransferase 2 family protein